MSKKLEIKELREDLWRALEKQVDIESYVKEQIFNNKLNVSEELPSIIKRQSFFSRYGIFYKKIEGIIVSGFEIIFILNTIYQIIKVFLNFLSHKRIKTKTYEHVFLINSHESYALAKKFIYSKIEREQNTLLLVLTSESYPHIGGYDVVISRFTNFLDFRTFFRFISIDYWFLMKFMPEKFKYFKIYSFNWLLQNKSLKKIKYRYLHSFDHFDRYLILAQNIAAYNKSPYHFHQHGIFPKDSFYENVIFKWVQKAYLLNENSISFFKARCENKNLAIEIIKDNLDLVPATTHYRNSILVVGNNICLKLHQEIIQYILGVSMEIYIYYKPHPNDQVGILDQHRLKVITDKDEYPNASLILSYPSTLLLKYQELGFPVVEHDLYDDDYKTISNNILRQLKQIT